MYFCCGFVEFRDHQVDSIDWLQLLVDILLKLSNLHFLIIIHLCLLSYLSSQTIASFFGILPKIANFIDFWIKFLFQTFLVFYLITFNIIKWNFQFWYFNLTLRDLSWMLIEDIINFMLKLSLLFFKISQIICKINIFCLNGVINILLKVVMLFFIALHPII